MNSPTEEAGPPAICFRIVLVEPGSRDAEQMAGILAREDRLIEIFHSGRAAFSRLQTRPADLVILCASMPTMDGFELMLAMRAAAIQVRTLVTCYDSEHLDLSRIARALGAAAVCYKPIDPDQFADSVASLLAVSSSAA